jgi:hypothetical protein
MMNTTPRTTRRRGLNLQELQAVVANINLVASRMDDQSDPADPCERARKYGAAAGLRRAARMLEEAAGLTQGA